MDGNTALMNDDLIDQTLHRPGTPTGAPPRVLMIVESAAGGTGRHVLDLADGMTRRGCDVHVIYSTVRLDQLFRERLAELRGVKSFPLAIRTTPHPRDLGVLRAVRRYQKQFGPFDIIHGHSSKGGALARIAALGTRAKAVYTLHGLIMMDPTLPRWKWWFYLTIELLLKLRTSKIIAVSPEEARAAARVGLGGAKIELVPNGIGKLALAPRAEARRTIGASADAVVIGFVGRLVEQKAPEVLIEAFATTVRAAPNARLALVGGGPREEPMRDLARGLGVADKIHWLGERDARGVLSGFDLFALSSRKEGLPYVVLEAMAAGLPVVATASAGVEILVEPGVNGAVVPPDNAEAFAGGLIPLATSPELLSRCGRASSERVCDFSLDAMVERTLNVYHSATRRAAQPLVSAQGH